MVLGIARFKRLPRFNKAYKRLNEQNRAAVDLALGDLLSVDGLPPGRKLQKVKSDKKAWGIRVNKGIRLSFEVKDGTCILRNVGEHDKTLDSP